ncbi:MAG TPA: hypothetical protein VI874_03120, partial [Candidatus Norongarragalinales archaeon]|nr:hypothetical protein [Candidatus Norongarragalinales archaeon]
LKVSVKRADKKYPDTSTELGRKIAGFLEKHGIGLSVKENKNHLHVELLKTKALIYSEKKSGLGGLPVGCTGKVVTLLSGGIDSPVASYLLAKRGVRNVYVHFHPYKPGEEKLEKIENLVRSLKPYALSSRLYAVPFMPFTLAALSIDERMVLPVFRRFMLRIAERIAHKENAKGIGTGDNLAQVASQTLENLAAIEAATVLPVLRPLLTYDKQEIIELAKRIGTYDLSLQAYNDCCQSLVAKHPATKSESDHLARLEERLPADLIEKTLAETKTIRVASEMTFLPPA